MREIVLGEVAEVIDCEHKTAPECDTQDAFGYAVGTPHLRNGRILIEQAKPVDEATWRAWTQRAVPTENDLIFAREAPVGQAARIPHGARICLGQRTVLIRPTSNVVDVGWLHALLLGPECQAWMESRSEGSTVKHLNVADVRKIPLGVLPTFEEQRRIAAVLGTLDDLIETNTSLISACDLMCDQLFEAWAADNHNKVAFGSIVSRGSDRVAAGATAGNFLGLEHFAEGARGLTGVGSHAGILSQSSRFRSGDVLFGKLRPYFRKVARPGFDGVCSNEIWVLRGIDDVPQPFVHWIARTKAFTEHATSASEGTRMPRATWSHVAQYQVPDPRTRECARIAALVDDLWDFTNSLDTETVKLISARDALLPLLLSGRVKVGDVAA